MGIAVPVWAAPYYPVVEERLFGQPADLAMDLKQRKGEGLINGNHIGKQRRTLKVSLFQLLFSFELF